MCGICGIVGGDILAGERDSIVRAMTDCLAHRGPQGEGLASGEKFSFGHRRLAVIDLQTGQQPMWSGDGRYCLTYNGEIYNYLELRQKLSRDGVRFTTFSDTEVLLNLLIRHDVDALPMCNGMFAFALYDTHKNSLLLGRDHAGVKPLYYALTPGGGLMFASEIKALFAHPAIKPEVSRAGLNQYMVFQLCLGEQTMFKDVEKLPPAHIMRFSPGRAPEKFRWWAPPETIDSYHTPEYFEDQLLMLLHDTVKEQLRSDVPLGVYLSGGLDSSIVTLLAAKASPEPMRCFTGRFTDAPGYDESHYARIAADAAEAELQLIEPTAEDFVSWMPKIIRALDEPVAGPGVFPQFLVSQLASQQVTVCLGGQGADEVFGGYARYLVAYLEQALKGAIFETVGQSEGKFVVTLDSIIPNLPVLQQYVPMLSSFWRDGLFSPLSERYFKLVDRSPDIMRLLSPDMRGGMDKEAMFEQFNALFDNPNLPSSINKMLYFDQATLLPALLQIEDRASMYSSLESRVPFLDRRIIEFAASMPPNFKLKDGRLKYALRKVVQNIVPSPIVERKDKMGFPVPLKEWMQKGVVREFARDILLDERSRQRGVFDPEAMAGLLAAEQTNNRQLWGALCTELWFRTYIDG